MKRLLFLIFTLVIAITGCDKKQTPVSEKISVGDLKTKYGIDLIGAWEKQFGAVARVNSNGKKKPEKNDVVNLILDGTLSFNGTSFTTSDHPKFAGVSNQTTLTSICNWFFFDENGPPQLLSCTNPTGSGLIMAWNTDWSDNVYRSNLITV